MRIDLTKELGITDFDDEIEYYAEYIEGSDAYKISINGSEVFLKDWCDIEDIHAELIAAQMLDILNIPRCEIAIGLISGKEYLLSYPSYEESQEFVSGERLFWEFYANNPDFVNENPDFYGKEETKEFNHLHSIWGILEWYIKEHSIENVSIKKLLDDLIDQFLFSQINDIPDFHSNNWGLLHKGNSLSIYPKFDNEMLEKHFRELEIIGTNTMGVSSVSMHQTPTSILEKFLYISEDAYLKRAEEMIRKLMSVGISNIINTVENKWNIKIGKKDIFVTNYTNRLNLVESMVEEVRDQKASTRSKK